MQNFFKSFKTLSLSSNAITYTPTEHKDLTHSDSFNFCSWKDCTATSGGAIYFHDNSGSLTVTDSLFEQCNSSSGYGGAIYCNNCSLVYINTSSFITCLSSSSYHGGGICILGASSMPEIIRSTFVSCQSGCDAGGLQFLSITGGTQGENIPVCSCRFIHCTAKGLVSNSEQNDGDGGGLVFWDNTNTF